MAGHVPAGVDLGSASPEFFAQQGARSPLDGRVPSESGAIAGRLRITDHLAGGLPGTPPGPGGRSAAIGMAAIPPPIHNVYRVTGKRRSDAIDGWQRTTYRPNKTADQPYDLPDDGRGFPKSEAGWYMVNRRQDSEPTLNTDTTRPYGDGGVPRGSFWGSRRSRFQRTGSYDPNKVMAADDGLGGRKNWNDPTASTPQGLEPESDGWRRNRARSYPAFYGSSVPSVDPASSYRAGYTYLPGS